MRLEQTIHLPWGTSWCYANGEPEDGCDVVYRLALVNFRFRVNNNNLAIYGCIRVEKIRDRFKKAPRWVPKWLQTVLVWQIQTSELWRPINDRTDMQEELINKGLKEHLLFFKGPLGEIMKEAERKLQAIHAEWEPVIVSRPSLVRDAKMA